MKEAFENMIANLRRILEEVGSELSLDLSIEGLYSRPSSSGQDIAGTLDRAVWHLLEAESPRLSDVLQAKEVVAATDLIRGLLERLKAEQSVEWALMLPVSKEKFFESGLSNDTRGGLSLFRGKAGESSEHRVSRQGATVFVEIDHDSETNFFTDLTSNIDRGGLFVATYDVLRAGTPLNIFLSLPGGRSFPLQGRVSWVREYENCTEGTSPGMGITFKQLTSEISSAICRYMTERPPFLFETA